MNDKSKSDKEKQLIERKLEEALKVLNFIKILGDAEWKKQRAREAIVDIERMK